MTEVEGKENKEDEDAELHCKRKITYSTIKSRQFISQSWHKYILFLCN